VLEGQEKGQTGLSLRKSHCHVPIPGGEALADVWNRAGQVVELIPATSRTHCVLVGHFWINRLIWARLQGLSFGAACASRQYRPETGSWLILDGPVKNDMTPPAAAGPPGSF
jgi:broad specificity phosphatase PhoE